MEYEQWLKPPYDTICIYTITSAFMSNVPSFLD